MHVMRMDWFIGGIALIVLVIGLIGQALEMRRIRMSTVGQEEIGSPNAFTDRRNFKWYAIIGFGIILWYAAEQGIPSSI